MRLSRAEQRSTAAAGRPADVTRADVTRADVTRADVTRADVTRAGLSRAAIVAATAAVGLAVGAGCSSSSGGQNLNPFDIKSFIDPTEMFPDSKAPLQKPILTSLTAIDPSIDDPEDEFYNAQDIQPQDTTVVARDYRVLPGDQVVVSVSGLGAEPGLQTTTQNVISESGNINLQLLAPVHAAGLTEGELQQAVSDAYKRANILSAAQVTVSVAEARGRSFSILGAVNAPSQYLIQKSDFRVLDALVLARDTLPGVDAIYVVRQLKEDPDQQAQQPSPGPAAQPPVQQQQPPPNPNGPVVDPIAPRTDAGPVPGQAGVMLLMQTAGGQPRSAFGGGLAPATPPGGPNPGATAPGTPAPGSTGGTGSAAGRLPGTPGTPGTPAQPGTVANPAAANPAPPPPAPANQPPGPMAPGGGAVSGGSVSGGAVSGGAVNGTGGGFQFAAPAAASETRTIRVPLTALKAGALAYNIVIRPGDLILCPQPVQGEYYMGGHVARTGVYSLSARKITIKQAVVAAGMLDGLAIPQRTELFRRVGAAREALVRIDIDAIFSGTQPDLFLKPNDVVQVGTNIFAPFISAVRTGFRITYGFGFLYDRNYAPIQNATG